MFLGQKITSYHLSDNILSDNRLYDNMMMHDNNIINKYYSLNIFTALSYFLHFYTKENKLTYNMLSDDLD
jgi:hypothetical protein